MLRVQTRLYVLLFLSLSLAACSSSRETATAEFEEITVKRINVVGPDGTNRIVLSNQERFPPPVLDGVTLPGGRSISPAGMVFYDASGNEVGGVAVVNVEDRAERVALILDYSNSEAIGLGKLETEEGYSSSLTIADRVPLSADIREVGTVGTERLSVANRNGTAQIVLKDGEGRPRIRLMVTEEGEARIEVLDEEGEVVRSLTDE